MSSARIEELRKKFDENPRRYFAPLANEYRKAGDFDQAIFICQEYLPQQPGHMSGHIVFGQALFEAKRLPEAKTVFETALSLDPENLIALRHLADISRELGDTVAARGWYERVLQADPRNEEIAGIMAKLGAGDSASPAEPQAQPPASAAESQPKSDFSSAPTVVLSAAQVQEMARARQAGQQPEAGTPEPGGASAPAASPAPAAPTSAGSSAAAASPPADLELLTLDATPTIEVPAERVDTVIGLEPTSQAGMLDLPPIEPLGLETNAAPGLTADAAELAPAPLEGLDTIPLEIALPSVSSTARTEETPALPSTPATTEASPAADDGGLLDLDSSFGFGGSSTPSAPPAAEESPTADLPMLDLGGGTAPSPVETPIDGGHDGLDLIDLDLPSAPADSSMPTLILDAVKSVVPAVQQAVETTVPAMIEAVETAVPAMIDAVPAMIDAVGSTVPAVVDAVESAAPKVMDLVDDKIPAAIDAVKSIVPAMASAAAEAPTVVMEAIRPPGTRSSQPTRPSQQVPIVTETMAQLYLSQGHRAEAIDIYRQLIAARPDDAELRARLAAIEAEQAQAESPQGAAPARRFVGTGPSIRAVLRDVFGLDGSVSLGGVATAALVPAEVGSIDMLFSTDASVAGALEPLAVSFDGGYVAAPGTIDALFAGGQ